MRQPQRSRMQMKLTREACDVCTERIVLVRTRVFHISHDWCAECYAVYAKLVRAAGQRPEFQPGELLPGVIEGTVISDGARGVFVAAVGNFGAFAAGATNAAEGQVDAPRGR